MLAKTILINRGNSFQLTSLPIQLADVTQYIDSQVGTGTVDCTAHNAIVNIAPLLM